MHLTAKAYVVIATIDSDRKIEYALKSTPRLEASKIENICAFAIPL